MNEELKIGVCGIVCGKCPEYTTGRCAGCGPQTPIEACPLPHCAPKKGVSLCFDCPEFPCPLSYEKGPIVSGLLDHWKKRKSENK